MNEPLGTLSRRGVLAGMALLLTGCDGDPPPARRVRIATGSPTAVYYAVGRGLADVIGRHLPDVDVSVLVTAASLENIDLVVRGDAELGFSQADILATAGGPPATVAALARVYDDLLHLVVRADSPIIGLEQLRGRRVSVGAPGSGTAVTVGRLLSVARLSTAFDRRELSLDESMAALGRGDLDAFFFSGGLPVAGINQLGTRLSIRLVDLSGWASALRRAYSDVYAVRDVPASAYGVPAVATVADPNLLVVATSMPSDLAYDLTKLLMERRETLAAAHPATEGLDQRSAIATQPVPLHPGAARYYRSVKP